MTMNKEFYPRGDVAQLCVFRKNVGRGLIGCENGVKSEGNGLGWYVKNNLEQFLVVVKTSRIITNEETVDPKNFKKTKDEQRENEWTAKRMHGQFVTDMENKETHNTWRRMRKSDLKGCTMLSYVVPRNSPYRLTISSTILTKLQGQPFLGCVVQQMRLYLL